MTAEEYRRRVLGKHSQAKGKRGESVAERLLRQKGVLMVEKIATPVKIVDSKRTRGRQWHRIVWGEKVSGDRRGLLPGGRRVLAEVKSRQHNLRWSDFQAHQIEALNENHAHGGLSLVVYIHPQVHVVMEWPMEGFDGSYSSITPEEAPDHEWKGVENDA